MPQSLAQIYIHIIFSTKSRVPFLDDRKIREKMHAYLAAVFRNTIPKPSSAAACRTTSTSSPTFRESSR